VSFATTSLQLIKNGYPVELTTDTKKPTVLEWACIVAYGVDLCGFSLRLQLASRHASHIGGDVAD
jgi:hypothetical protein